MDGGIAPDGSSDIKDPEYRFQLYLDWKNVISEEPNFRIERFCRLKGVSIKSFEAIMKEFD